MLRILPIGLSECQQLAVTFSYDTFDVFLEHACKIATLTYWVPVVSFMLLAGE